MNNIQKYNAFSLPWFNTYFKTSWTYTHLFNNSSCTPLGIVYICSTRDNNVIDLYKSMIKNNIKRNNAYMNANIPKCIILLHISNNHDDDIETDVQKLFVNIQSTFLNYKCHLLIIKAHRFLNAYEKYERNGRNKNQEVKRKIYHHDNMKNDMSENLNKNSKDHSFESSSDNNFQSSITYELKNNNFF